ncbi:glycosyltransferase family 4 protein [Xylanimonas ulmi]|uniref:Glycosyltransferase involved in cell wall biosynthesis n=1 Tax=Xylanimonas ulmi TaxID=228973 RepID=A0A4Q7M1X6_9MICO|nr:glycosyltransferase family 4 protein [Xylanibacterium ulmi]RZS61856.1 glycosyltransferase involved in cell wall biosynthesis [Xylanibacterium ulmi]
MGTGQDRPAGGLRVLVIPSTVFFPPYPEELPRYRDAGVEPRAWINEVSADLTFLDQRLATNPPRWLRALYRPLPMWAVQVAEAYRVGHRYDVVFCWSVADVALVLAAALKLTFRRLPVVALFTRVSEAKKAALLRRVHTHLTSIILPPVTQREFAVERLGVPAEKLVDLPWTVDTEFWSDRDDLPHEPATVCAAGGEMRDYATLVRAMDGLDIPCHIAGSLDTSSREWWRDDVSGQRDALPPNVTLGPMDKVSLRALYARARVVVVPLRHTDSDNGITCMDEAWSMGKPVVVSQVAGQRDAFVGGTHGQWTPVGDVQALREAIVALWNDPARAEAMGAAGRALVTESFDHRVFADGVTAVLSDAARLTRRRRRARGRGAARSAR